MIEVERKFEVDPGFVLPPLTGTGWVTTDAPPFELSATYYDTADLRLARARTTLRRRTGGADAGWHLKVPLGIEREEIQLPLGSGRGVPAELSQLVLASTRGERLRAVARLATSRSTRMVSSAEGMPLVEVADDRVRARRLGQPPGLAAGPLQWREIEAELLPGAPPEALAAVGALLADAGARPARSASKLAHVLGDAVEAGAEVPEPRIAIGPKEPVGESVTAYFRGQIRALLASDPGVRRGSAEAVATMAAATRRVSGALRVFGGLLDPAVVADFHRDIGWLDGLLWAAYTGQTVLDRLGTAIEALPDDLALGASPADLTADTGADTAGASAGAAQRALRSRRYLALLDGLVLLAAAPPLTPLARSRVHRVLPAIVGEHLNRLDRRITRAGATPTDREVQRCREAAGWLQCAAEAAVPSFGAAAAGLAARAGALGAVLDDHQSSVVAGAVLLRLGQARSPAFAYGLIYAGEQDRQRRAICAADDAWQQVRRKRYRRWLR